MKLNEEERALFDAILAGAASAAPFGGDDEELATKAAERGEAFVKVRKKHVEGESS